ncbi:hypothetical protein GCM10017771_91170 [Streptomyces capitiformicae]|uniref:Uncharacterized protein n=1 Tax=Streptomyces capitiformicae TaxID=2014920 RepID=A0A918ZT86_9ACTN|nr:hypothetical protein GCM10017771_91170 [Streptomyces capitiformicae]
MGGEVVGERGEFGGVTAEPLHLRRSSVHDPLPRLVGIAWSADVSASTPDPVLGAVSERPADIPLEVRSLLSDPGLLLTTEPTRVIELLGRMADPWSRAVAAVYRTSAEVTRRWHRFSDGRYWRWMRHGWVMRSWPHGSGAQMCRDSPIRSRVWSVIRPGRAALLPTLGSCVLSPATVVL